MIVQSYAWDFNTVFMGVNGRDFTYLQDEMGSVVRLLEVGNEGQTVYGYDEFGEDTYSTQGRIQPFGYTGYRYDNVANTYFAQAREYVAGMGRFAGEDLIKGYIIYPTSLNPYGYCFGNPEKFVDLDGKLPTILIGAGLGAVFGFAGGMISEGIEIAKGNQKNINWKNVLVDTASGAAVGAIAGTGAVLAELAIKGAAVGAVNYLAKTGLNNEWKSKSLQEHFVDGAISSAVWGISAAAGGTMKKEVEAVKQYRQLIGKGIFRTALQKDIYGSAYKGLGKHTLEVAKWGYSDFIKKMTVASINTNLTATFKTTISDITIKFIKDKIYKKRDISDKKLKAKFKKYRKGPTKVGRCFIE